MQSILHNAYHKVDSQWVSANNYGGMICKKIWGVVVFKVNVFPHLFNLFLISLAKSLHMWILDICGELTETSENVSWISVL